MIGDDLTVCMGGLIDGIDILLEKIKVCTFIDYRWKCLFWIHCEEKICLEASRCFETHWV